jgi:formylglycine-generating enzyme required for sulfatase activity
MDKYEASVWQVPATNKGLIAKIQNGTATLANLQAGGATQISPLLSCTPVFPGTFPANGQQTQPLYAVSIPGVYPTGCVTWFQAQQACGNSRKRLPSNAEWQLAVAGTPDPVGDNLVTDCNTTVAFPSPIIVNTGSRSSCKSTRGAFDMVGNVNEWVADWVPRSTTCGSWSGSGDSQCLAGAATTGEPGALVRGGSAGSGLSAGPLAVDGRGQPSTAYDGFGFRCAR